MAEVRVLFALIKLRTEALFWIVPKFSLCRNSHSGYEGCAIATPMRKTNTPPPYKGKALKWNNPANYKETKPWH